jgi:hypothetical protein
MEDDMTIATIRRLAARWHDVLRMILGIDNIDGGALQPVPLRRRSASLRRHR